MNMNDFDGLVREMNRQQNFDYLNYTVGEVQLINHNNTDERRILLPRIGISFQHHLINEFPMRFRAFIDQILQRVAEERSMDTQRKKVKPVSKDHGRQYFITKKILEGKKCENNCSICLEPLLPEGTRRKKVWELGCGCSLHSVCIRKWQKQDSRCPNCRFECAV